MGGGTYAYESAAAAAAAACVYDARRGAVRFSLASRYARRRPKLVRPMASRPVIISADIIFHALHAPAPPQILYLRRRVMTDIVRALADRGVSFMNAIYKNSVQPARETAAAAAAANLT